MIDKRTILTDADHESISLYSVDMLLICRKKMEKLEELYEKEHLSFPIQCKTNFRDAWFHYKKIYERNDEIKVMQEQYAMEEHLIRVLKDAITVLFNTYSYWIQNVYHLLDEKQSVLNVLQKIKEKDCYKKCKDIKINTDKWYASVKNNISGEEDREEIDQSEEADIKDVTLCMFLEQADIKTYKEVLQKCMHKIKNYSLRTRLEGIEIYRPENSDKYLDDFTEVFGEVKTLLEEYKIFPVISSFSSFFANYCYDKDRQDIIDHENA